MKRWFAAVCLLGLYQLSYAEYYDPMQPPAVALEKYRIEKLKKTRGNARPEVTRKAEPWVLSSILYSEQRKHAIINNQLVKQGEMIRGAKVLRLRPDSVRLLSKGKIIDLKLRPGLQSIKKSHDEKKT